MPVMEVSNKGYGFMYILEVLRDSMPTLLSFLVDVRVVSNIVVSFLTAWLWAFVNANLCTKMDSSLLELQKKIFMVQIQDFGEVWTLYMLKN